jgi:hypothetical protein
MLLNVVDFIMFVGEVGDFTVKGDKFGFRK